jgi:aminoglycoside phosphotransferase (APT) family kinase protein
VAGCSLADPAGVLALEPLPGVSLGAALRRGEPPPPAAGGLLALAQALQAAPFPPGRPADPDARLRRHERLLTAVLPEQRSRIAALAAALSGGRPQPAAVVHGDFHEGNVLVGAHGVSGLLDLDGAGSGALVDDFGLLVGRVWALADGPAGRRALDYAGELLRCFDAVVDPVELRRRAGVAVLGRATGPFRNQLAGWRRLAERRLALAEAWAAWAGF